MRPGVFRLRVVTRYKPHGQPVQAPRTFHGNKRQAQTELAKFVTEVETGTAALSGAMTVKDFLARFLDHAEANLSLDTVRNYRSKAGKFTTEMGGVRLDKLRASHLDDAYRKWRAAGVAPSTIRAHHAVMASALSQAKKWGLLARSVAPLATLPKVEPRKSTMPTIGTIQELIRATENDEPILSMAIVLAALTGARRGELLGLR